MKNWGQNIDTLDGEKKSKPTHEEDQYFFQIKFLKF